MLLVALKAGLRRGELRALRWSDVDFDRRIVHVRQSLRRQTLGLPKGGRAREVEMSDDVKTVLLAHRHRRSIYVFCGDDGEHFTEGDTRAPLERIRKRAGLRHMLWHVCRHTFCSHLVMRGIPMRVVQLLAGHTSYKVTERYAHLSPEIRGQAVRVGCRRSSPRWSSPCLSRWTTTPTPRKQTESVFCTDTDEPDRPSVRT